MILAVLQARMTSERLPGKVLKPILGEAMLARQIERLKRCRSVDRLIVATSTESTDYALAALADASGVASYRGALDDVLDRIYRAAVPYEPSHVVRLTADCPLADWQVIDRAIHFTREGRYDYGSNTLKPTWPDGLDVEVVAFGALETAWREADSRFEREHVTPFLHRSPERFRLGSLENDEDLSGLRWTVDEPEDFAFVTRVYEALYPSKPAFTTSDILAFLAQNPEVAALNAGIGLNEAVAGARERLAGGAGDG